MEDTIYAVNTLLVELFNDILSIERDTLKKSKFSDLSVTEIHIIEAIGMEQKNMTELSSQLGVTVGTLTTSINRLVKKEYVSRTRGKTDRRYVEIMLTEKGKLAYSVHEAFHEKMVRTMTDKLSKGDNEILIESLKRLNQFFVVNDEREDKAKKNKKV